MTDFCIETTAIHDEYIDEYNRRFAKLREALPNTQFICVTTNPSRVDKHPNLKVVDIKKYTNTNFVKSYDHEGGFCEILQATRFGIKEAFELGYLKVLHLQTDITFTDEVNEETVSNHFVHGLYWDMGGATLDKKVAHNDNKAVYFYEKYIGNLEDAKVVPVGDDPVAMFKFNDKFEFKLFLEKLDMLCEETYNHPGFTTGIADELAFAMYLTGIKSYYDYNEESHCDRKKYFDVNHGHLHIKHYDDRDPTMLDMREFAEE